MPSGKANYQSSSHDIWSTCVGTVLTFAAAVQLLGFCAAHAQAVESTRPVLVAAGSASLSATQAAQRKGVLILSGTQYGRPVNDVMIAAAVDTLKSMRVSVNDVFVEHLDMARNDALHWRAKIPTYSATSWPRST